MMNNGGANAVLLLLVARGRLGHGLASRPGLHSHHGTTYAIRTTVSDFRNRGLAVVVAVDPGPARIGANGAWAAGAHAAWRMRRSPSS